MHDCLLLAAVKTQPISWCFGNRCALSAANSHHRNACAAASGHPLRAGLPRTNAMAVVAPATLQRFSRSLVNLKMQQFPRWWVHHDVDGLGEGLKRIRHARLGEIGFG